MLISGCLWVTFSSPINLYNLSNLAFFPSLAGRVALYVHFLAEGLFKEAQLKRASRGLPLTFPQNSIDSFTH